MKSYSIITENDISEWNDETGARYHFPNRYKNILKPGTNIIYYKGRINDKKFKDSRQMNEPHYFGYGIIGKVYPDEENSNNYYAEIDEYAPFPKGVYFKRSNNSYYEDVSKSNYWRDGVRKINADIYSDILKSVGIEININNSITTNDNTTQLELVNNSIIKYKNSNNTNIISRFTSIDLRQIGDKGEQLVLSYLKKKLHLDELETLRWVANEGETPGYDIEYFNLNKQRVCIEVKSTTAKKFPYFHLTINEYNASLKNELYFIYLVSNCKSNNPKLEIIENSIIRDNFKLEPIVFKVYQIE